MFSHLLLRLTQPKATAVWLTEKELDVPILGALLNTGILSLSPTAKAFISQIKLISGFAEMTSYLTIKSFLHEGFTHASMLPGVGAEVRAFLKAEKKLRDQHGDDKFPYLKCLRLPNYEKMAPVNYPNLCKVEREVLMGHLEITEQQRSPCLS